MTLAHKDPHFTPSHQLPEPLDVLHRHPRVPAAVVDQHRAVDVDVSEADRLSPLEAHEQVDRRVGVGGGEIPDGLRQTRVVCRLPLLLGERGGGYAQDGNFGLPVDGGRGGFGVGFTGLELRVQEGVTAAGHGRSGSFTAAQGGRLPTVRSETFALCPAW